MESKNQATLPTCEEQVYLIVATSEKDMPIMEIVEQAKERFGKEWKFQTVATFLHRLEEKKYLSTYRINRFSYYRAVVTLEQYKKQQIKKLRDLLFEGDCERMIEFIDKMKKQI